MAKHLFGIICTHYGAAANNRGETEGNITTLQKLLWNGAVHTSVSAEAIRWAIRQWWQAQPIPTNRRWDEATSRNTWEDHSFTRGEKEFIDDDVLGYMSAEAGKEEANASEAPASGKGRARAPKGKATVRRARLEVTRAVSLTPWSGDITFNAASIGATPSAAMKGNNPVPYGTEMHATRYQYGFALTPESLANKSRSLPALDAITQLGDVAGNHARFLYDFAPESIVLRWTDDFAPRILYGFEAAGDRVGLSKVLRAVEAEDIDPADLIIGGAVADDAQAVKLKDLGAAVFPGVRAAGQEAAKRMRQDLNL